MTEAKDIKIDVKFDTEKAIKAIEEYKRNTPEDEWNLEDAEEWAIRSCDFIIK